MSCMNNLQEKQETKVEEDSRWYDEREGWFHKVVTWQEMHKEGWGWAFQIKLDLFCLVSISRSNHLAICGASGCFFSASGSKSFRLYIYFTQDNINRIWYGLLIKTSLENVAWMFSRCFKMIIYLFPCHFYLNIAGWKRKNIITASKFNKGSFEYFTDCNIFSFLTRFC